MSVQGTVEELRTLAQRLCVCQAQIEGSLPAQERLVAKQSAELMAQGETEHGARCRAAAVRQGRASALSKRRVNEIVSDLIGKGGDGPCEVAEYIQIGALFLPTEREPERTVPLIVPFFGHGNVALLPDQKAGDELLNEVTLFLVLRALERTAPRQVEIASYDPMLRNVEAPFSALVDKGESANPVRYCHSATDLDVLLGELTDRVTRVRNAQLVEAPNCVEQARRLGSPPEPYQLVVLHDYPKQVSEAQHRRIQALAQSAPATGISFVFCLQSDPVAPSWFNGLPLDETEQLELKADGHATWRGHDCWVAEPYRSSERDAREAVGRLRGKWAAAALPDLPLGELLPCVHFGMTSEDGISVPIGTESGEVVEVTLGSSAEQRHNALVTGAVGQGKSNLVKVIVYGLCARYSPRELELYLLDFKEGVTLYPMAPTPESPECLPHVRAFGLEADQDYGVGVLRFLVGEMRRRSSVIKPYGDNLLAYRRSTGKAMARILLVVDEFQLLLEGDKAAEAQRLLEQLVRLGRATGMHVILASQSIGGITSLLGSESRFFAQFPVRIGLKNSPEESRATFGPFNDAAAHLRFRGQAILNENYGERSANRTVLVARADDEELSRLRDELYHEAAELRVEPSVFDGSKLPSLGVDLRCCVKKGLATPFAMLGKAMELEQSPVAFSFDRAPGRNLAIVGRGAPPELSEGAFGDDVGRGVMESVVASLACTSGSEDVFVILDFEGDAEGGKARAIERFLKSCGRRVEMVSRQLFESWVTSLVAALDEGSAQPCWVIAPAMDRAGTFDFGFQGKLQRVMQNGPSWGVHFVLRWTNASIIAAQLGPGGFSVIDGAVLLFGSQPVARQVIGALCNWNGEERRVLYRDASSGSEGEKLVPYAPLSAGELLKAVRSAYA